ncbi:MAG: hypothetical protein JXA15_02210 [Spirochaetales bacterium]|nr:hypothetical protein [Spirochaetales bacterium]
MKRRGIDRIAVLVFALSSAQAFAQVSWWESDALGLAYRQVAPFLAPGLRWSLKVERSPGLESRVLYRGGREHSSLERSLDPVGAVVSERETLADGSSTETFFLTAGFPSMRTERFVDGSSRVSAFEWADGRLVSITVTDGSGSALWKDSYRYAASGEPTEFRRTAPDGSVLVAGAAGASSWLRAAGLSASRAYDPEGRLVAMVSATDSGEIRKEANEYEGDSRLPSRVRIEEGESTILRSFDASGRLVSELETRAGEIIHERLLTRNAAGLVTVETERSGTRLDVTTHAYRSDGTELRTEERIGGLLSRAVDYAPGGLEWTESLYDRGVLFARRAWSEGRAVREELWADGVLVRERSLP